MLRLRAPAKINLTLEVLGPRGDGYHEVRSILQAIDLEDELTFADGVGVTLSVEPVGAVPIEANLVLKAAELMRRQTGISVGAAMHLKKTIPIAAGLGGGSSDAAATLLGLRRLWDIRLDRDSLLDLASQLGSDVPFFIQGGTALASGRGELLEQTVAPAERHAVIVVPEVAGPKAKTAEMYAYLTPAHYSDGARTVEAARRLHNGTSVGEMSFNVFEAVAWRAGDIIETMRVDFLATHGANPILCGAGPAMFSLFNDKGTADRCAARMRANGYRSFSRRLIQEWPIDGIDVL